MKNCCFFNNSELGFHFSVARYQDADQEAYFHHPQILVEAFHHILNHCLAHVQLRAWHPQWLPVPRPLVGGQLGNENEKKNEQPISKNH